MAILTVQQTALAGITPSWVAAAAGGDEFRNTGHTYAEVKNASGGDITVTVVSQQECDQGYTHDETVVVVATTGVKRIGPFDPSRFNNESGNVELTYSGVTSLTVGAFEM